jgi:hypothetical protein
MSRLRIAALVSASSVGLHELRWALAPAAGEPSHGYIPYVGALAGLVVALAVSELLARVSAARRSGRSEDGGLEFRRAWPLAAVALLAIFSVQELLEGAVLSSGFWLGLPLALVFGALVALGLIGARALVAAAARAFRRRPLRAPLAPRPRVRLSAPAGVISAHLAGRAPPRLSLI